MICIACLFIFSCLGPNIIVDKNNYFSLNGFYRSWTGFYYFSQSKLSDEPNKNVVKLDYKTVAVFHREGQKISINIQPELIEEFLTKDNIKFLENRMRDFSIFDKKINFNINYNITLEKNFQRKAKTSLSKPDIVFYQSVFDLDGKTMPYKLFFKVFTTLNHELIHLAVEQLHLKIPLYENELLAYKMGACSLLLSETPTTLIATRDFNQYGTKKAFMREVTAKYSNVPLRFEEFATLNKGPVAGVARIEAAYDLFSSSINKKIIDTKGYSKQQKIKMCNDVVELSFIKLSNEQENDFEVYTLKQKAIMETDVPLLKFLKNNDYCPAKAHLELLTGKPEQALSTLTNCDVCKNANRIDSINCNGLKQLSDKLNTPVSNKIGSICASDFLKNGSIDQFHVGTDKKCIIDTGSSISIFREQKTTKIIKNHFAQKLKKELDFDVIGWDVLSLKDEFLFKNKSLNDVEFNYLFENGRVFVIGDIISDDIFFKNSNICIDTGAEQTSLSSILFNNNKKALVNNPIKNMSVKSGVDIVKQRVRMSKMLHIMVGKIQFNLSNTPILNTLPNHICDVNLGKDLLRHSLVAINTVSKKIYFSFE